MYHTARIFCPLDLNTVKVCSHNSYPVNIMLFHKSVDSCLMGNVVIVAHDEGESDEIHDKTYYVFLPPELCLVHPLPGSLVRGAQRLPSIMRRVESMLLAVQLRNMINYPVQALKVSSQLKVVNF